MAFLYSPVLYLVEQGHQKFWLVGVFLCSLPHPSFSVYLPILAALSPCSFHRELYWFTFTLPQDPASFRRASGSHWLKGLLWSQMPVLLKPSPCQVSMSGTIIILQMMERIKEQMNTVSVYLNGCNEMPEAFCGS